VVAKLKDTLTGDTLCDEASPVALPGIVFPEPAISFAIQPKTRGDEDKISTALHRMTEEDPTLHHHFDPETKQLLVSGMGQLHVETVVERMKRKYNVDVSVLPPRIPYKETVKGRSEVQGKYKKQTGGRGQYGDVWLKIEPLQRGGGFEFVDDIFGGAVPRNFIPSVEKGVRECMKRGIFAGYRWSISRSPSTTALPRRGLLGHGLPDRRVHGPPEGVHRSAPDSPRAGHEHRSERALRPCRRRHRRS
jgi:elongation factor G